MADLKLKNCKVDEEKLKKKYILTIQFNSTDNINKVLQRTYCYPLHVLSKDNFFEVYIENSTHDIVTVVSKDLISLIDVFEVDDSEASLISNVFDNYMN